MPLAPYQTAPYRNPYASSMAALIARQGEIQAQGAQQRGAIWGNTVRDLGTIGAQTMGQLAQYQADAPRREEEQMRLRDLRRQEAAQQADADLGATVDLAKQAPGAYDPKTGKFDYDVIAQVLNQGGFAGKTPEVLNHLRSYETAAMEAKTAALKFEQTQADALASAVLGLKAHDYDPQSFAFIVQDAAKRGLLPADAANKALGDVQAALERGAQNVPSQANPGGPAVGAPGDEARAVVKKYVTDFIVASPSLQKALQPKVDHVPAGSAVYVDGEYRGQVPSAPRAPGAFNPIEARMQAFERDNGRPPSADEIGAMQRSATKDRPVTGGAAEAPVTATQKRSANAAFQADLAKAEAAYKKTLGDIDKAYQEEKAARPPATAKNIEAWATANGRQPTAAEIGAIPFTSTENAEWLRKRDEAKQVLIAAKTAAQDEYDARIGYDRAGEAAAPTAAAPAPVSQAAAPAAQAPSKGVKSRADVIARGQQLGLSPEQAIADATARGYVVR